MKKLLSFSLLLLLLSFKSDTNAVIEFRYPKNKEAKFTMDTKQFKSFTKEWRGEDYYFMSEGVDKGFMCSVLFYKLNSQEQKKMVEPFGGMTSAGIPFLYFSETSNLKKYESNNVNWGKADDDFMFRHNDILEVEGVKIKQKHMYAYAMFGKDLFVNVHLSKVNCSPEDSLVMRKILDGLKK
jgi:hypothetical protein